MLPLALQQCIAATTPAATVDIEPNPNPNPNP